MQGISSDTAPGWRGDGPARVLLVDDDPDIRYVVRLYLERMASLEVVGEAADGFSGIEQARELQPDVVLLDVMMPVMNGQEAIPELLQVAPRSMIVMLSALQAGTQGETALTAGAFAYIEKSTIDLDLGEQILELFSRFSRALDGLTAWAPEHYPH